MTRTATALGRLRDADLDALIEHAPDGIFIADIEGRYIYVNEAGCRLLGYTPEERGAIVGKTILDLIPPEDAERLAQVKAKLQRGGTDVGEWNLRRKDGTRVPAEVTANILPDGQWQGFVRDISERKAHEAERDALLELTESDRRWLQAVLDAMPLGVILYRPGGPISFNRRAEELLGVPLSPMRGREQYADRIRFPDGRAVPSERMPTSRMLAGETLIAEEYKVARPDGTRSPVLVSGAPIRDAEGRMLGAVAAFQDVSERMRMEEAIRANERLLKAIFEILPVGVWIADATGHIVSHNPAGERIWRGARHVPISEYGQYRGWWVGTNKPIATEEWGMARAVNQGETSTGELIRIQCFDGSLKTIIHSAAPLRDENGALAGAIVVNEDITALHEAQEKQRESEQLLRTVIDLLPVGLYLADRNGQITFSNPAAQNIWQGVRYVPPERYGEYQAWWVDTGQPITAEEWGLTRALKKGETSSGELIRIRCFDGSFKTVINWAAPIRSDAGEIVGAVAINEDVTSLQHTQEQLRAAVRAREEILAAVTHDLRNPLSGLLMGAAAVEHTARQLPGGEPVRELAVSLMDITRRMSGMVDDLLAVAVARAGGESLVRLAPVPASALVARAAEAARPLLARESLELKTHVVGDLPTVHADADRILRVFGNLLDNALKYTEPRGSITLSAERTAGGVRFSVANSGPPLPKKQLEAMFRPFWQASRDHREGAGLGLAICRSIVEAHGGSIWAEPAEGQRVRVCFVLPRQPAVTDEAVSSA